MLMRRVLLLTVSALVLCSLSRAAEPTFSITISTPRPVVPLGTDVRVAIELRNVSARPIDFSRPPSLSLGERFNEVEVKDEQGNPVPETKYYRVVRGKEADAGVRRADGMIERILIGGSILGETVEPGGVFPDGMILNKLVDIRRPGTYTITVLRFDEATKSNVRSNTITLTVTK